MTSKNQPISVSFVSLFKVAFVVLGFIFLFLVKEILAMLFLAIIIASSIAPLANFFETKKIPRIVSVLVIYILFISILVMIFYLIIPPIISEIGQFAVVVPDYYESISKQIFKTTRGISPDYALGAQDFLIDFGERVRDITSGIFRAIFELFGNAISLSAVLIISFYLSIQKRGVEEFLRLITPQDDEKYIIGLWKRVEKKLGKWLAGQLLLGVVMGVAVFVGLSLIGVPYALLLGVVAGLFEILPVAGPVFSAILGVLVAVVVSPVLAFLTFLLYFILQQLENHILVPVLMKHATGLNPVVVLTALLIGAKLGGMLGMVIAVPLATIGGELLEDVAKRKAHYKKNS